MRDKTPKTLVPVIIGVVVALSVATGIVWAKKADNKPASQNSTSQTEQTSDNKKSSNSVTYDGVEGKNALELLKAEAEVVTKQSSFGEYVDSINGVVGGTDGKYWAFYINGELSQVGAADYQTRTGDKLEWKFE